MTDLMDDVLILGKINAGVVKGSFGFVNIVKIALEIANRLNEVSDVKTKIFLEIKNEPQKVWLDEKLIIHILMNLLHNAQKYSLEKGDVQLILAFEADQLKIEIKDRGIGISEEDMKHLFQPFHRGINTSDIPGTGLGLAIVFEYVNVNNGDIKINSALNKGTNVSLTFPYKK
jgi:signal transduction histidine kinase